MHFFKDHQRLRIGREALSCKQGSCIFLKKKLARYEMYQ